MAEVKWIKIVVDIFDDEKVLLIESLPEGDSIIVIWFKLLCLAGKNNNSGVFMMNERIAYTEEMLSTIFRRSINIVRLALKTFETYGMVEILNNVITIPNWSKHQSLDQLENKKEYMREYMKEYRDKQKELTLGKTNSKTNSKTHVSSLEEERERDKEEDIYNAQKSASEPSDNLISLFNVFWEEYPKKRSKGDAEKAFKAIKPSKELVMKMVDTIRLLKKTNDWKKEQGKFIPYPATWLRAKGWEDEVKGVVNETDANDEYNVER